MDGINPTPTCVHAGPPPAFDPAWLTEAVCSLADAIDADRAFDRLPILADALEDAGCEDAVVLRHCRECPRHAAGCWVVRGILETHLPPTVTLVVAPAERVIDVVAGRGERWAAWLLAAGLVISLAVVGMGKFDTTAAPRAEVEASGGRQPPDSRPAQNQNQGADAPRSPNPLPSPVGAFVGPSPKPVAVTTQTLVRSSRPRLFGRLFRR